MVPKLSGQGLEGTLGVNIGFYNTGHPSIALRDQHGDRLLTVDYRGYVPNLHVAVPMGYTQDIEGLFDKGVICSCKPVKTVLQDGELIGMFQLTHRCVLEVFNVADEHYSALSYVDVDLVSLQDSLVRGPFRARYQSTDRNTLDTGALNPENNLGNGTRSILEYTLEKAKEHWGNNSDVGILIAQDGDNHSRVGYTNLAWVLQKRLRALIVDELTTHPSMEIKGQYSFEDKWDALKQMIQHHKVPPIRLGEELWEIKYYEFPLERQYSDYNDWYYHYDCLGLHRVESNSGEQRQDDVEDLRFTLLDKKSGIFPQINQNHTEHDTVHDFTLSNLNEYPRGILEYAIQSGRKTGLPYKNTRIVVQERYKRDNNVSDEVINVLIEELEGKHGFVAPPVGCRRTPLEHLENLINFNNQTPIDLPSGKWVLTLGNKTCPERSVKDGSIRRAHKRYRFLELTLQEEDD